MRDRVIFVKDITNEEVKNYAKYAEYNNVIFFTSNNENEQIWYNGEKCSGITRIDENTKYTVNNYNYSVLEFEHKNSTTHDIRVNNYRIQLDYNPSIQELVKHNTIKAKIIIDNGDAIKSCTWQIENNQYEFKISNDSNNNSTNSEVIINYNPNKIDTSKLYDVNIKVSAIITTIEGKTYNLYANIVAYPEEIVPYNISAINLTLNPISNKIQVDESLYLNPQIVCTTLNYNNTFPSYEIEYVIWKIKDPDICKISSEGILTGIYSPKFGNKSCIMTTVTCIIKLKDFEEISKSCDILIFKKYQCSNSNNQYLIDNIVLERDTANAGNALNSVLDNNNSTANSALYAQIVTNVQNNTIANNILSEHVINEDIYNEIDDVAEIVNEVENGNGSELYDFEEG